MKPLTMFLACLLSFTSSAQQKVNKHHMYVSAGTGSLHTWGTDLAFTGLAALFNGDAQTKSTPVFTAGYQYSLSAKFRAGTELVHNQFKSAFVGKEKLSFTSILLRADYTWFQKKSWRCYSGISLGCLFVSDSESPDDGNTTENNPVFTGHVYAFSCDYSFGPVALFLNLGAGASGFVNTGISIGF